jgi:sialidase-1
LITRSPPRRRNRTAVGCLLFLLLLHTPPHASNVRGDVVQTRLFVAGTGGYQTYRIPSLIVTKRGTVLAFAEGRRRGGSDAGEIDVLQRRSLDGGKTWKNNEVVWHDGSNTCGNPCPVVDQATGVVWLLLTHNLGEDSERKIIARSGRGTRTVWVSRSDDDGESWTPAIEITRDVKRPEWTWYATGPGIGIQTASGRLVVPCDDIVAESRRAQSHVILSDDQGAHWKLGGTVGPGCNESQVVELTDGRLMLNMRSTGKGHRRRVATSRDGGLTWTPPTDVAALIEPVCQASIMRYSGKPHVLLFSNPASLKRERLTVRSSTDDGQTWSSGRVLHAGPAAYSCLTSLPDGQVGCLYECGEKRSDETLTFARFGLADVSRNLATANSTDTGRSGGQIETTSPQ